MSLISGQTVGAPRVAGSMSAVGGALTSAGKSPTSPDGWGGVPEARQGSGIREEGSLLRVRGWEAVGVPALCTGEALGTPMGALCHLLKEWGMDW